MDITSYYFVSKPIFESLKKTEIAFLKNFIETKVYRKNKEVFREGTYPKGVYILEKGKIKIYQNTFDGSQQIITIHIEGEIFGYRPVLCDDRYPVSASAIEDCRVSFIPKKVFLELLSSSSALSNILLRNLSREFTVWVNMITNLGQRSVKERLFLNLLILTEKYRGVKKWPVEITLSRSDLAALTGTSNETLARMIKKLKSEKIIATKGRTILINGTAQTEKIKKALSVMQM
jgi:CRP-like cAMP-binding protein